MSERRKILVTGAAGFVGKSIVEEFRQSGDYRIYCLVRKKSNFEFTEQRGIENVFQGDVADYETLEGLERLNEINVVVHTAGLAHQFGNVRREEFWRVNVKGTENVCRLARQLGAKQFVLISSVSVYGNYGNTVVDETFNCQPDGFYAESKLESEKTAVEFCRNNKIGLTILRLATVIGEGDRGNTARLITTLDKGRFFWIGEGTNKKSLIYKKDVARGVRHAIETLPGVEAEIYNLTGETAAMKEIVGAICRNLGRRMPRLKVPESLPRAVFLVNNKFFSLNFLKKYENTFEKWLSEQVFSGKKFKEKFGFEVETPVSIGIARQVGDYLKEKKLEV